jgi:DNA-binding transcriptional regulator YdaS (Cro superfamily)
MDAVTIRVAMAYQDLSTDELAARAGISRFQVWRWRTGRPQVAPATAARIERALLSGNGPGPDSGNEAA